LSFIIITKKIEVTKKRKEQNEIKKKHAKNKKLN